MDTTDNKLDVLITSVPPEAKGGILAIHQILFGKSLGKNINLTLFPIGSPDPFKERSISRLIRVIIRITQFFILLIKDKSIRIIHINTAYDQRSLLRDTLFVIVSRLFRKKIIIQIHQRIEPTNNIIIDTITKYVFRLCNKVLVFSKESKKNIETVVPMEKIEIFPNPVIVNDFEDLDKTYKKTLSIPEEAEIVLFLSRLIKEKGVHDLIESIPEVIRRYENVYFVFAGEGPDRPQMEMMCKMKGIEKQVRFTGHIPYKDVVRAFSIADIFVLPTYFPEGMPMAILQALAAGLPIISTPISSIPDIVTDGINGFLVEPHASDQLAEKILLLLCKKELRKRMGEENIKLARKEYDLDHVLKKLEQLYSSI